MRHVIAICVLLLGCEPSTAADTAPEVPKTTTAPADEAASPDLPAPEDPFPEDGFEGFEREVALKLVHAHLRADEESRMHLLEEARLAARIRHLNLRDKDLMNVIIIGAGIMGTTFATLAVTDVPPEPVIFQLALIGSVFLYVTFHDVLRLGGP